LGTSLLSFMYSGSQLSSITDIDGNAVTIDRSTPNTVVLTAPFGQKTQLSMDADRRLVGMTDPLGQTISMTYDGDLLTSLDDPLRGKSTFEYDGDGRLLKDTNAGGGFQQFNRIEQGRVATVTRTTAMGRSTTYERDLTDPTLEKKTRTAAGMTETRTR